jgi:hypothetical protein
MNKIPKHAADIILKQSKKRGFIPGIYLAPHTFGRDLKNNLHIHLSTTVGGLSLDHTKWIDGAYFHHESLKKQWKYAIVSLIRSEFKAGKLSFPKPIAGLARNGELNRLLDTLWAKTWVVELGEQTTEHKNTVGYIGKYLKRPPLSETRIKSYDGHSVTFEYLDHYTGETADMTLPAPDFIGRLVTHIPERYFKSVRYYGFLSNRLSGKLMPIARRLLGQLKLATQRITWRQLLFKIFRHDPLICPRCGTELTLVETEFPLGAKDTLSFHQAIANGHFQLL